MTMKKVGDQTIGVIQRRRIDKEGNVSRFQEYHTSDEEEEEPSEHPPYNKYGFMDHLKLQMEDQRNKFTPYPLLPHRKSFFHVLLPFMSSVSSAITYTSVYTDSEPGRAFWGSDDEEPVAPPSPDYIPGPEDPQTPPVPQDEDEREPMFVQAHDPDYVPEPVYPEYIPLEDEHVFPAEEQPLPPVDSPTAESPGYITESDPEEDPEEYEDDETEDGPVDYPMDGGDDGDDDDGDSSGDDADDEDEDDEDEEEEEEHLAPADSTIVVPTDEPVSPPEGTEPAIPPPSTDITIGARITVRPQASISLPPEAERLARCTAPPAHSSPPPVPSPLLPSSGCLTQIQTLRIASTQALIDAVTAALPSPPLPPPLYIPPPIDRRDDIPESEQPPRKRDTWIDPVEAVPKIAPMTVGEDDSLGYCMDGGGRGLCFLRGLASLDRIESGDPSGASDPS
ncbi:hypothetical protein Tco_0059559 [Tanacetum coccineum]